jgi:hypothetical protein
MDEREQGSEAMTAGEMAYLVLVIGAFLSFIVVLGWVSRNPSSRPVDRTTIKLDSGAHARPA